MQKIIYQTSAGEYTDFEFEYIDKILFSKITHQNFFDYGNLNLIHDNAIIVYSDDSRRISKQLRDYFKKSKDCILLHLSNESLDHKTDYYKGARFVFRSYWNPFSNYQNTFAIPLGFKAGLLNKNKEELIDYNRSYIWSFCGQIKSHRLEMKRVLQNVEPYYIHTTSGWSSDDQLSVESMADIYKQSVFIPCPFGNINPDSFRIMESLEYGCIPVCIKFKGIDYYKYIYGDHPFIIGNTWQECLEAMNHFLSNSELLLQKQLEIRNWYSRFINNLSDDIASIVAGNKTELKSVQFKYQKKAGLDLLLKVKFYVEFNRRLRFLEDKYLKS